MHRPRLSAFVSLALALALPLATSLRASPPAPQPRLLAVFSHPDDELFCAGTLARAAAAGLDVLVAYSTSGGRGQDRAHRGFAKRILRTVRRARVLPRDRERETRKALRALGISRAPLFLRLGDGEVTRNLFRTANRIERILRDLDPEYVLTMGPQGVTGHRDHVATSAAVSVAFQRVGPGARLLHVVFSAERARLFQDLWKLKTVAPRVIDHLVPVRDLAEVRAAALEAHRTQFTRARLARFQRDVLAHDTHEELREVEGRGTPPPLSFGASEGGP